MIANVPLTKRGAPIFHGEIDLRLLIKAVKRVGICDSFTFCGGFQVGITMFYLKDSGSVLITAYAFGVALATVTVLLCGRFNLLCYQDKIGCRLCSRELLLSSPKPRGSVPAEPPHICWHILDPWGAQGIAECLL